MKQVVRNIQPGCEDIADIYVRVSTDEQIRDDKTSIPDQIAYVRANLARLGFREGKVWQEVHSASTRHRPVLQQAMARVRRGEVGGLIVAKADRFIRNPIGLMVLMEDIKALNVGLIAVLEGVDSRDAHGVRIWQSMIEAAEWYRMNVFDNTMNARLSNAKNGKLPTAAGNGGVFGYIYHRATKDAPGWFERDPVAAPYVVKMFRWSHDGWSNYRIAAEMQTTGIPTARGPKWHATTVGRILRNRAYLGEYTAFAHRPDDSVLRGFPMSRWKQHWDSPEAKGFDCPGVFPAILDTPELRALFSGYEGRAEDRKRYSPRNSKRDYLLRGMLRCEQCGNAYGGETRVREHKGKTYTYTYYVCSNPRCPNHAHLRMHDTDALAWQMFVDVLTDPDKIDALIASLKGDERAATVDTDIDRLTRAIATVEADIVRNLDLIESGTLQGFELADRQAKRQRLLALRETLVEERQAALDERSSLAVSAELEAQVRAAAAALRDPLTTETDPAKRRRWLEQLRASFLVRHTGKKQSALYLRFGGDGDVFQVTDHLCSTTYYNLENTPDPLAPFRALPSVTYPLY